MPVDRIFGVKIDSRCKVRYGIIKFEESVPDQSPTIVSRCISLLHLDYLVEVFEGLLQSIATNLLPDCAKMVHGLHV